MLNQILIIVQVVLSLGMIALILLQKGKGAEAGAAFGGGASGTVFGAQGSANFLSRTTAVFATLFIANSLALAYLAREAPAEPESLVDRVQAEQSMDAESAPAEPVDEDLPEIPVEETPAADEAEGDGAGSSEDDAG